MAAPPLGLIDAGTGGLISGSLHNVGMAPTVVAHMAGRMTSRDADNIKSSMTRAPLLGFVWQAGEWLAGD
jgi:hypothetical protein